MAQEDHVIVSTNIPVSLRDQVQEIAAEEHRTLSNMIRVALWELVSKREDEAA